MEETALVKRESFQVTPIIPRNYDEVFKMGKMMAQTDMVPKDFKGKEANTIVAIQLGLEVGLLPMQALQNIAVINGRPCIWGDAQIALVRGSGHLEWMKETGDMDFATCEVKRYGEPNVVTQTFRKADAERAGLWNKVGPWKQYPKRMLQMRARSFALRDLFSDVLKGIQSREEVQDIIDVEAVTVTETEKAKAKKVLEETENQKPDLELLKDKEQSTQTDLPIDDPPQLNLTDTITTDQFTVFLDRAKELKVPTKILVEFSKKNGFDDVSQITTDKYPGMLAGLEHLTK